MRQHPPQRPLVLLVDQDPVIRQVLQRALNRHGVDAILAEDGIAALTALQTMDEPPSLIITAVTMRRMNGRELCAALAQDATWSKIPVLLISSLPDVQQIAHQANAAAYLQKPFALEVFIHVVDRWCYRSMHYSA